MKTISIVGLGLMGSSLGLALKKRGVDIRIKAYARRQESCDRAKDIDAVDEASTDLLDIVSNADIVVVCVPILSIVGLIKQISPKLKRGAIVTDVGSTKTVLSKLIKEILKESDAVFVGSHPIAGSEKTGVDAGNPDLYEGHLAVVCAADDVPTRAKDDVLNLWKSVGSEVIGMSPEEHDGMLASTSHLTHMVASALARSVDLDKANFCGTGFKDTTRVASGSADMWVDIIDTNREALAKEVNCFNNELQGLIDILQNGNSADIRRWLEESSENRNSILCKNRFLK